jgi:ubiquinone/menaquinone biosynthesis C-methylase UbiE
MNSVPTPDYSKNTLGGYQSERDSAAYAGRQWSIKAPVESLLTFSEKRAIRRGLDALESASHAKANSALDVPAGAGKLTQILETRYRRVVSGDISQAMLAKSGASNPLVVDATDLPFSEEEFDVVVCLRLLQRVPEEVRDQIVGELCRVAKLGVVISYSGFPKANGVYRIARSLARRNTHEWYRSTAESFDQLLQRHSFGVVADGYVLPYAFTSRVVVAVRKVVL